VAPVDIFQIVLYRFCYQNSAAGIVSALLIG